jgi:hypothetical protein
MRTTLLTLGWKASISSLVTAAVIALAASCSSSSGGGAGGTTGTGGVGGGGCTCPTYDSCTSSLAHFCSMYDCDKAHARVAYDFADCHLGLYVTYGDYDIPHIQLLFDTATDELVGATISDDSGICDSDARHLAAGRAFDDGGFQVPGCTRSGVRVLDQSSCCSCTDADPSRCTADLACVCSQYACDPNNSGVYQNGLIFDFADCHRRLYLTTPDPVLGLLFDTTNNTLVGASFESTGVCGVPVANGVTAGEAFQWDGHDVTLAGCTRSGCEAHGSYVACPP